jgi:hypothetical protein
LLRLHGTGRILVKRRAGVTRSGHDVLALLTRLPVPGRVKTRLVPAVGAERAAAIHRQLTEQVAEALLPLAATGELELVVFHDGGSPGAMRAWLGPLPRYEPQVGGDLGRRLRAIFEHAFRRGARRCIAVGSDCPALTAEQVRRALAELDRSDVVFGPATDGGYWLVGIGERVAARALPVLFDTIAWGTEQVLGASLARAAVADLSVSLLEELSDIDRPDDLPLWEESLAADTRLGRLSIVIPALDESLRIATTVRAAMAAGAYEVIVVDGGSGDGTKAEASAAGALVIDAPRGRARQMNAGAARAGGEALLFLHADTTVPAASAPRVCEALARRGVVAGAFDFAVPRGGPLERVLTIGARARCRLSGYPYGDQGLFLRARTFRALGGFPDLPVMEDWELVHRLRRLGRIVVLPEAAVTSPRAFHEHGLVLSSAVNVAVIVAYQLGVSAERLAAWRSRLTSRAPV